MQESRIEGNVVDVHNRRIFQGSVCVLGDRITRVEEHPTDRQAYIMPGFVDSHIHIESSMLTPENFGKVAVRQGTVAIVTDPHEIANVLGVYGIEFMLENSKASPLKTFFSIPSCVPATGFDCSGAKISATDVERLAASGRFVALSEMMNVPGVLFGDEEVRAKLRSARKHHLPIDGHCPMLSGEDLKKYASNGISTDHESTTFQEGIEKIKAGMRILIREGSAAQNFDALNPLIPLYPEKLMFCSDDAHPQEILRRGHIRDLVARSVAKGYDLFDVVRIASVNPVDHYKLDLGLLREGDKADFIVVEDLKDFKPLEVYIEGEERLSGGRHTVIASDGIIINKFHHGPIHEADLAKAVDSPIDILSLISNEIVTARGSYTPKSPTDNLESDVEEDILKLVYVNRYTDGRPQVAYCKGFGLRRGAIASSVAHDSHNLIAVGCTDRDICAALNALVFNIGGLAAACGDELHTLPLPIGGLMSTFQAEDVDSLYIQAQEKAKEYGCGLYAPFMTLSFLSLLVIPEVKIGERGLFSFADFNWLSATHDQMQTSNT